MTKASDFKHRDKVEWRGIKGEVTLTIIDDYKKSRHFSELFVPVIFEGSDWMHYIHIAELKNLSTVHRYEVGQVYVATSYCPKGENTYRIVAVVDDGKVALAEATFPSGKVTHIAISDRSLVNGTLKLKED